MIIGALYYFLPAYIANFVPPIFRKIKFLNQPLDFNIKFKGQRLLGANKTFRGLLVACVFGLLTFILQRYLYNYDFFRNLSILDYQNTSLFLGFLLGFGAILGDAIESFFKRRVGVKSGKSWIPFDQLDFVIGGFFLSFIVFIPDFQTILWIVLLSPILQLIAHYSGFLFGINKDKI